MKSVSVSICSRDGSSLLSRLAQSPIIDVQQCTAQPAQLNTDDVEVLVADPDLAASVIGQCQNLKWLQSTWAGNAPLVNCPKRDYQLTVARGIFDTQIREYVFTYLLAHVRKVFSLKAASPSPEQWQSILPDYAAHKTLGVLGTGSLAQALIPVAKVLNIKLIGLSRSGNAVDGFAKVYTLNEKQGFAEQADFVVNLLPDTPATTHVLDETFFRSMKTGSLLINAGRGSAIEQEALLRGLDRNQPAAAILDVFDTEPLPENHPFWHHPNITVTHHTAAITQIGDVAALFIDNAQRYITGQPLQFMLDWERGY